MLLYQKSVTFFTHKLSSSPKQYKKQSIGFVQNFLQKFVPGSLKYTLKKIHSKIEIVSCVLISISFIFEVFLNYLLAFASILKMINKTNDILHKIFLISNSFRCCTLIMYSNVLFHKLLINIFIIVIAQLSFISYRVKIFWGFGIVI